MQKGKIVGLLFLVLVLVASSIGVYHYSQQMTVKEKRAELLAILSDGKYDKDYSLVDLAGSNPASLTERVRAVEMRGYDQQGQFIASQVTLGYVYSQKYVIVPNQLFWVPFPPLGRISVVNLRKISIKLFLLPDPNIEDTWKEEELGEIKFMSDGSSGFAVIERIDPILGSADLPQYALGKYGDLSLGDALYQIVQANGRIEIVPAAVRGLHTNKEGRNLINFDGGGEFDFSYFGGLLFAIRDGKFELVGPMCMLEPMKWKSEWVFVYGLDINQIIAEIEKIEKK